MFMENILRGFLQVWRLPSKSFGIRTVQSCKGVWERTLQTSEKTQRKTMTISIEVVVLVEVKNWPFHWPNNMTSTTPKIIEIGNLSLLTNCNFLNSSTFICDSLFEGIYFYTGLDSLYRYYFDHGFYIQNETEKFIREFEVIFLLDWYPKPLKLRSVFISTESL
jgi:hypothetical protein